MLLYWQIVFSQVMFVLNNLFKTVPVDNVTTNTGMIDCLATS